MDTQAPGPGHNRPPPLTAEELQAYLAGEYVKLLKLRDDFLGGIERAPLVIENDETAGRMGDFSVKQLAAWLKSWEGLRISEKEPYLSAGRTVDGFFQKAATALERGKAEIDRRRKLYADKKAAIERAAREAEARRIAEEVAKREAEARRLAQEAAKREAEAQSMDALDEAIDAHGAAAEAAKAAAAKEEEFAAAQRAAAAKSAELSRTRGDHGSVTSLKEFWTFRDLDRARLDLEALRQHLPEDALEKAIRSFIKAGGRKIDGAHIYQDTRL